jgi:hypothetical protein
VYIHSRLSEQFSRLQAGFGKTSETQAAIRRPETSSLKRVTATGRNFTIIDFVEASRNFILDFLHKKTIQIVLIQKVLFKFLGP